MNTYTARTPVDLLALVPYVIGFHPEDSVVMLTFGDPAEGAPASFHARIDLPLDVAEQLSVARMLRDVAARHGITSAAVVIYSDDVEASALFATEMAVGLAEDGVHVLDLLRVDGDRFAPADDPDHPGFTFDLRSHPFTAQGVLEGRVVHESRSALRDSLVGTDEEDTRAVSEAVSVWVETFSAIGAGEGQLGPVLAGHAEWLHHLVADQLAEPAPLDPDDAARLIVLVSFEALREVAWAPMTRATAGRHVELWSALVRRAPADLVAGASGLLAFAAWLHGDGALAWCAVDRCLEADPDDALAQHVAALVESATPPAVWAPAPVGSLRIFTAFGTGSRRA